jgi:hypothetical protein
MKKISLIAVLSLLVAGGALSAQGMPRGWGPEAYPAQNSSVTVTVEGSLALVNGAFAVQSGKSTYYVPWIRQYIGFIDGLKEGAPVKIAGSATPVPDAADFFLLFPTQFTINNKEYDFSAQNPGYGYGYGMHRGRW